MTAGVDTPLVLASASPRRAELLARIGLDPVVDPASADESLLPDESASDYVLRVAADKARVVAARHAGALVLGADTAVVLEGSVLGKPAGPEDAEGMLELLSGRTHDVLTAVVVTDGDVQHSVLARATVTMAPTDDRERRWYVATGEPLDKAGGYAVQGIGAVLVDRLEGDPTTVIGLPLRSTVELLVTAGLSWP